MRIGGGVNMKQPYFTGPFASLCEQFVSQKKALGIGFLTGEKRLRQFDNFCKQYQIDNFTLTEDLVIAYSKRKPNESDNSRRDRICVVRTFAIFLQKQGYKTFVLPELPKPGEPHKPYIFTKEEMNNIFNKLDSLEVSNFTTSYLMFPALFRLLYGCGLRISEALSLTKGDIDTNEWVVHVLNGKNGRERFVPMSKSLIVNFKLFLKTAHANSDNDRPLFYNKNNLAYSKGTVSRVFKNILWDVGIPYLGGNAGPRVHDIRHTFMCHNIRKWAENNIPINSKLIILSKYVGHTSVRSTEWYLRLTSENYPHIREICEAEFSFMYKNILDNQNFKEDLYE